MFFLLSSSTVFSSSRSRKAKALRIVSNYFEINDLSRKLFSFVSLMCFKNISLLLDIDVWDAEIKFII